LGRPRVFMRKFRLTIRQMLEKFGERDQRTKRITDWSNFSDYVREQWRVGQTETRVEIIHFVMPNDDFNPYYEDSQSKPFASYYYESGISETQAGSYDTGGGDSDRLLRQSGYDYFPALVIRFKTTEGDSYGIDCPGMTCLGDVKQLQIMHKRKAQAIEKIVNPPMNAPGTMKSVALTTLPGKTNYLNARAGEQGFSPAYQITFDVRQIENEISQTQLRINRSYYNNYFFATINDFRNQRATAREVDERSDEKIAAVGPLLEKLNWEWADALVDIWFQVMYRQGKLPPAPEGLRGEILKVEYISIMAQAQKQLGVGTLERFAGFIGPFAQVYPSIADKINSDEFIDEYADSMGVSPRIIRSIEEVEQIRLDRQEQIEQQQALEASSMAAKTAKDLGSAELTENNILGRLANSAA
ncbi:MAG TPA: portal protein, partial [Acidobacteriota bacterium]|nr:portal protein [Acidobacteriota bacterium]